MDLNSSCDTSAKKVTLEELSKEELLKKCRGLLTIAQKAKQAKDAVNDENNLLKGRLKELEKTCCTAQTTEELVDNLTQQKLSLVTSLEELKSEKVAIHNKLNSCQHQLSLCESKISDLDTENQCSKRQVNRLTDENEQLIVHLDNLEKQIEELNKIGMEQQKQLLELESNNNILKNDNTELTQALHNTKGSNKTNELQSMLSISLEEIKKLQNEIEALTNKNESLIKQHNTTENLIGNLRQQIKEKEETLEKHFNSADDLNTELHKNRAVIEKLKQDLTNANSKLADNQIVSSGVTSDLQNVNEKLREKVKFYHSKLVKFAIDAKVLKQNTVDILRDFKSYIKQVNEWKNQLRSVTETLVQKLYENEQEMQRITGESSTLICDMNEMNEQKLMLNSELQNLKIKNEAIIKVNSESQITIQELQKQINSMATQEAQFIQENKDLSEINKSLQEKVNEIQNLKVETAHAAIVTDLQVEQILEMENKFNIMKRENSELLAEMNEMNQVLKERGETISKQQEYYEEIVKKLKTYEIQSSKTSELLNEKESIINNLKQELTVPSNEGMDTLHDADDTMSSSTISKIDEINRLKDLEGSWEERYGKLRSLAVKLKGKIRELTTELTKEQSERTELQQKFANNSKTIQSLQSQCDQLQDELDISTSQEKTHLKKLDTTANEVSKNKKQLTDRDETITKLKVEIENMNKEKAAIDNWKKQVGGKVQTLKKELEANLLIKRDYENRIEKLTAELVDHERNLKEEIERHNQTKNSLQESHNECKKKSVLNLEMQDYERSLKDIKQKLDKKVELVNKFKNQVESQKSTVSALKEQNRLLEDRIQNEESDLNTARNEINAYKKSISDLELLIGQKDEKVHDLIRNLETTRLENEELSTELSKVIAKHQKVTDDLKGEKELLRGQNLGLEQRLRKLEDVSKLTEDELKHIQTEYQGYKVRAQSVLRQNQTRDIVLEEKLTQEASNLKAQITVLTSQLEEIKANVKKLQDENNNLLIEKEKKSALFTELDNTLLDQKKQNEYLSNKYQQIIAEHAETIRGLKVHADTLAQCYRQQLSEQEIRHNREIIELQSRLDKGTVLPEIISVTPATPREECEGSECVEPSNSGNIPVPLEKLLNNESDQEVSFIKRQLSENEAKVTHLTALLADTEQDLVKHVQMNKLLKEEIRRQQRSVERERHAENLEYLKNVVFKFITLSSGDERSRLVPVLNTILKLSPEEATKLNMVAKGEAENRGWSNYLPLSWPSNKTT